MFARWRKLRQIRRRLHPCPECGVKAFAGWVAQDGSRGGNYCVRCEYGVKPT